MSAKISIETKIPEPKKENFASLVRKEKPSTSLSSPVDSILFLQRSAGNQAVQRLIKSGALQAKLKISQPDDIYEQEADRLAERIVAPAPQSKCAACNKDDEKKLVQFKAENISTTASIPDSFMQNLGPGQPLDPATRTFFEPRFGHNFSRVRVHADAKAAEAAQAVNARAFTVGKDVAFGEGEYGHEINNGQRLLAHVVQQSQVGKNTVQRTEIDDQSAVCEKLDDIEKEIDDTVNRVLKTAASEPDGNKRVQIVYNALGQGSPFTTIENMIEKLPASKFRRLKISETKFKDTAQEGSGFINAWWKGEKTLGVVIKVAGNCIGSDKIGHFFQQGRDYFRISVELGKGDAYARGFGEWLEGKMPEDPDVAKWIQEMDNKSWPGFEKLMLGKTIYQGVFGLSSTGVYSRGDLEANQAGLAFYKQVAADPHLAFSIRSFLSGQWSEVNNPSCYTPKMAEGMASTDPQFQAALAIILSAAKKEHPKMSMPDLMSLRYDEIQSLRKRYQKKFQCNF